MLSLRAKRSNPEGLSVEEALDCFVATLLAMTSTNLSRRARFDELVDNRVHQRLERCIDDIGRDTDGTPRLALLVGAFDQNPRHGLGAAIEDTHAIIDQLEAFDEFLVLAEVLAQCDVERE